jgi:hypothetical protein
MRKLFICLIFLALCSSVFSQSNFDIVFTKIKNILLTKESFEKIARDGFKGTLVDQGKNSPSSFYQVYQISESDSLKNIAYFSFDYNNEKVIIGMYIMLREPVLYEKGSMEVNYRLFYGDPEILRGNNSGRIIRFEFYHEISKYSNRYHLYMIAEKIHNRVTGGFSDGIMMWGWTTDKEEFLKGILE